MTFFVVAVLAVGNLGFLAALVLLERMWAHERRHLTNSVVARHAPELAVLEQADRTPPVPVVRPVKLPPRRATDTTPGVNDDGQLVDVRGQVVDESAMIGIAGN